MCDVFHHEWSQVRLSGWKNSRRMTGPIKTRAPGHSHILQVKFNFVTKVLFVKSLLAKPNAWRRRYCSF
jgi:hypothetical protein